MFGVFVMLGLGAIALPTEATTARSTMFGSILEPAPPTGSIQSFCRYCGSREREDNCTDVTCQLTMGRVEMHVPLKETPHHTLNSKAINVTTRGYNKNTPMGPTIKVKPGDTLKVTLINNLTDVDDPDAQMAGLTNYQHDYQATNLHTHGLHISGEDPADNVFRRVAPGDNHTYTYVIPEDHMPGTHWYHPHFHGPTGIQAGGGAVGLLIVEDVVGEHGTLPKYLTLPKILKEEKHLIILGADANNQKGIERGGQGAVDFFPGEGGAEPTGMLQCCLAYGNKSMSKEQLAESKLCSAPVSPFTAEEHELLEERGMRNREAHLNDLDDRCKEKYELITDQMYIVFPEFCEAQLLAKDGVYLHDAPRPVKYAFLGLGNRADLLIKFADRPRMLYPNPTLLDGLLYNQNDEDVKHNKVTNVVCNAADAIPHANKSDASVVRETLLAKAQGRITIPLMYMEIVQGVPAPTCTLPKFTDLTQDGNLELHFGPGPDSADGKFFSDGSAFSPFTINKKRHVIPFQLQTGYDEFKTMRKHYNLSNFLGEPYFQAGDWHDTLQAAPQVPPNWCHNKAAEEQHSPDGLTDKESANNLTHVVRANDWGMMTILNFTENSDGNFTFWGNKLLDPTCFQGQPSNKGATVKAKDDGTFTGLCCAGKHDRAGCGGGECIGQYYESLGYEAAVYVLGGATRDLLFSTVPVPDREPDYFACA
ncbi:hypothetical protein EMIHUDRAFT_454914 [Emiliania huxleyi CCMP1516]|uniref:Plastocyanin-like domain-containing protein n=2 Tax=Emiliania huxleyi TaxID=2903 RepID=A0A0D3KNU7_EMIH1|nr:hypothetical protein EMIHUDRAFT_454914 [Emiliania huxleyi CCMP1516]EOD37432.1 hypothetical protein EMIHUDRAFT_454914 [Emiliania huxleyi CCMP1516]|eukprot:XP_005789861.1 hypothetical protein EMIHUDRAFT_454914 [Emiliania huxleyi CCMP1516]